MAEKGTSKGMGKPQTWFGPPAGATAGAAAPASPGLGKGLPPQSPPSVGAPAALGSSPGPRGQAQPAGDALCAGCDRRFAAALMTTHSLGRKTILLRRECNAEQPPAAAPARPAPPGPTHPPALLPPVQPGVWPQSEAHAVPPGMDFPL